MPLLLPLRLLPLVLPLLLLVLLRGGEQAGEQVSAAAVAARCRPGHQGWVSGQLPARALPADLVQRIIHIKLYFVFISFSFSFTYCFIDESGSGSKFGTCERGVRTWLPSRCDSRKLLKLVRRWVDWPRWSGLRPWLLARPKPPPPLGPAAEHEHHHQ